MGRWVVILRDCDTDKSKLIRKERFDEHFAFLRANFSQIVFSCGLDETVDTQSQKSSYGGLWMVEADSCEDVILLYQQDPYYKLGLRDSVKIFEARDGYI